LAVWFGFLASTSVWSALRVVRASFVAFLGSLGALVSAARGVVGKASSVLGVWVQGVRKVAGVVQSLLSSAFTSVCSALQSVGVKASPVLQQLVTALGIVRGWASGALAALLAPSLWARVASSLGAAVSAISALASKCASWFSSVQSVQSKALLVMRCAWAQVVAFLVSASKVSSKLAGLVQCKLSAFLASSGLAGLASLACIGFCLLGGAGLYGALPVCCSLGLLVIGSCLVALRVVW